MKFHYQCSKVALGALVTMPICRWELAITNCVLALSKRETCFHQKHLYFHNIGDKVRAMDNSEGFILSLNIVNTPIGSVLLMKL